MHLARGDHRKLPAAPSIAFRRVTGGDDIETMRLIRNECRGFMTRDRREISCSEQCQWWSTLSHEQVQCYLFQYESVNVGYGVVRAEISVQHPHGVAWLTGGLLPAYRGRGLGRALFQCLIHLSSMQPWLEVLRQNERARRLYEELGFRVVWEDGDVLTMTRSE
jgi:ribosomal protein S18 acetylase RimI-like enzyme